MRHAVLRAALLLLALGLLAPARALAHTGLRSATPAAGDTLSRAPEELRLRFYEAVEPAVAHLELAGPSGTVALGPLESPAESPQVLAARIRGPLVAGTYTVAWQVVGRDGHPVRGSYSFTLAPGAEGLAPPEAAPAAPASPAASPPPPPLPGAGFDAQSPLYAAVRWLTFLGVLGVVGAAVFRLGVLPLVRCRDAALHRALLPAGERAARVGLAFAALAGVAAVLRLLAQAYALHGAAGVLDAGLVGGLLSRTLWGWGWLLQAAGVVAALAGFVLAARGRRGGWVLAAAGAVALAFSPALSGHAGAADPAALAVLADGVHVLGAGGWLGSLLAVVAAGVPAALRAQEGERGRTLAALVNAFSPTALLFAGVVVLTGVVSAWLHLGALADLWETAYGRTLLLKLAVLPVVFGTGAYNWLRVRPALGRGEAAGKLRRSAAVELAAGVVVLAVTAALVATPPPADTAPPPAAGAER